MREQLSFDKGWFFHQGDIEAPFPPTKAAAYDSAKTERALWGPAWRKYPIQEGATEAWEQVDLPHDFIITGEPSEANNAAFGYVPDGSAWYIKHFSLTEQDKNRRITLLFDGVAVHATVWVNGCLLKHNFSGYTSFEVDITDVVKYDCENVVAVYVDARHHEGWWYEGGGIYRHVWLGKTDLCAVDLWGVYVKPQKRADNTWDIATETTLRNDTTRGARLSLIGEVLDGAGNVVATYTKTAVVGAKDKRTVKTLTTVTAPALWSPDSPTLYTLRTRVLRGGKEVDVVDTRFGFRTLHIDPDTGLYINGKHYKIQGLCGHADFGLSGKAVPDNIHRHKVALMKEMGANGYRTSHYPQASELMDALDENGFIVMDEVRWFDSSDEGLAQLEMLMKRDRNRPSVVFWSLGNEEPHHATDEGRRIAETMLAHARRLDDTRFIMTAICHSPEQATVCDVLPVIGVNYNWSAYDALHQKYPNKPILSSENSACGTTRGYYGDDKNPQEFFAAYDHDITEMYRSRAYTWRFIMAREWMLGGYQWTSFEHRGEATWPRLCSQSGAIDLFMQKKDAFYQNQSFWSKAPMVHLLPHWDWQGKEGEIIRVFAYSNTEAVELFLNGESLGLRALSDFAPAAWEVPYTPGKLEAVAYQGGEVVARDVRVTSGAPHHLVLEVETPDLHAGQGDMALLSCYVVDADGNPVWNADPVVRFACNNLGTVYSSGSDITDHSTIFSPVRKMRCGRIGLTVKVGEAKGTLVVSAACEGLFCAEARVEIK